MEEEEYFSIAPEGRIIISSRERELLRSTVGTRCTSYGNYSWNLCIFSFTNLSNTFIPDTVPFSSAYTNMSKIWFPPFRTQVQERIEYK